MSQLNEEIFRRWVDSVWIKGEDHMIDEILSDNIISTYPNNLDNKPILGKEKFKEFVRFIRGLFTNINITIDQITANDNKVVALCTFAADRRSISEDNFFHPKPIKATGLCQMFIENGKIVQTWSNIDLFGKNDPKENDDSDG